MKNIKNPRVTCEQLHQKIRALLEELKSIPSDGQPKATCIIHTWGRRGHGGHRGHGVTGVGGVRGRGGHGSWGHGVMGVTGCRVVGILRTL